MTAKDTPEVNYKEKMMADLRGFLGRFLLFVFFGLGLEVLSVIFGERDSFVVVCNKVLFAVSWWR